MAGNDEIQTGVKDDDEIPLMAMGVSADVWAFATDGETTVLWAVDKWMADTVHVEKYRFDGGLDAIPKGTIHSRKAREEDTFPSPESETAADFAHRIVDDVVRKELTQGA